MKVPSKIKQITSILVMQSNNTEVELLHIFIMPFYGSLSTCTHLLPTGQQAMSYLMIQ